MTSFQTVRLSWSGRLAVLIGLAAIGSLGSAGEARAAGCVVPAKTGSAPTAFLSTQASVAPIRKAPTTAGTPQSSSACGM